MMLTGQQFQPQRTIFPFWHGDAYKEIFDPRKADIYIEDIRKNIEKEWNVFENIFGKDKESFSVAMKAINKYRADAHAKPINKDEMDYFRVCATRLETYINEQE